MPPRRGLTLTELLVAVVLGALIVLAVGSSSMFQMTADRRAEFDRQLKSDAEHALQHILTRTATAVDYGGTLPQDDLIQFRVYTGPTPPTPSDLANAANYTVRSYQRIAGQLLYYPDISVPGTFEVVAGELPDVVVTALTITDAPDPDLPLQANPSCNTFEFQLGLASADGSRQMHVRGRCVLLNMPALPPGGACDGSGI